MFGRLDFENKVTINLDKKFEMQIIKMK